MILTSNKKINVLVIPDLFPKYKGDVQGIFVLDYLTSTKPHCNNTVLFAKLIGDKKGLTIKQENDYLLYKLVIATQKLPFYIKPFTYLYLFIKAYRIGKTLKNVDIIHAHGTIVSGTLSFLLSKKLYVPFIITEHQGPFSMTSNSFWKRNWTRFIMQKANSVLTVSEHLKQEILTTDIHPEKMDVTHNPVDTDLFKLKQIGDFKNILFVGRLDNFKGALRCLQAFDSICNQFNDWTFTIVGDGEDLPLIKEYLQKHSYLKSRIILKGQLTKSEITKEMQVASFLVFPSKHESFGLVIAEALSSGLPVIVGNTTAPKEFVNTNNGLLVDAYNITELSSAMKKMIETHKQYNSESIRESIIQKFGFENFGKKLHDIYLSTINKA